MYKSIPAITLAAALSCTAEAGMFLDIGFGGHLTGWQAGGCHTVTVNVNYQTQTTNATCSGAEYDLADGTLAEIRLGYLTQRYKIDETLGISGYIDVHHLSGWNHTDTGINKWMIGIRLH